MAKYGISLISILEANIANIYSSQFKSNRRTNLYVQCVQQSDRNSSKTDRFHKPTTYEQQVLTSSEQKITFARHEYGQVGVFRIKKTSLVQKL